MPPKEGLELLLHLTVMSFFILDFLNNLHPTNRFSDGISTLKKINNYYLYHRI